MSKKAKIWSWIGILIGIYIGIYFIGIGINLFSDRLFVAGLIFFLLGLGFIVLMLFFRYLMAKRLGKQSLFGLFLRLCRRKTSVEDSRSSSDLPPATSSVTIDDPPVPIEKSEERITLCFELSDAVKYQSVLKRYYNDHEKGEYSFDEEVDIDYPSERNSPFYMISVDGHRVGNITGEDAEIFQKYWKTGSAPEFFVDFFESYDDNLNECISCTLTASFKKLPPAIDTSVYNYSRLHVDASKMSASSPIDPNNPIYEKRVVFTGDMNRMDREKAFQFVIDHGGDPSNNVTKGTAYLVVGEAGFAPIVHGNKTGKIKQAEEWQSKGSSIQIISETQFFEMMDAYDAENKEPS